MQLNITEEQREVLTEALQYAKTNYTDFAYEQFRKDPDDLEDEQRALDTLVDQLGE